MWFGKEEGEVQPAPGRHEEMSRPRAGERAARGGKHAGGSEGREPRAELWAGSSAGGAAEGEARSDSRAQGGKRVCKDGAGPGRGALERRRARTEPPWGRYSARGEGLRFLREGGDGTGRGFSGKR